MVMMMVAFRFHFDAETLPPAGREGQGNITGNVDIFVQPVFGFYGFLIANLMILAYSVAILSPS